MSNLAKKLEGKSTRLTDAGGLAGAGRPAAKAGRLMSLEVERIQPDPSQPRKHFDPALLQELADSLTEHGQLQPVLVRLVEGEPILIAGERRWQAAKIAGLKRLDAVIRQSAPDKTKILALVENLHREDLGPLEEAEALKALKDEGHTLKDLARITKLAPSTISEKLSLCDLPEEAKADLRQDPKALPSRQLVEVAKLARRTSPENAMRLYNHAKKHGMTRAEFRRPGDAAPAPEPAEEQETAPELEPGEAEGADLEENLKIALLYAREGARERWAGPIKTGLSDEGLKEAIGREFGEFTRLHRGDVNCSFDGGKEPKFWLGYDPDGKPALAGKQLVDTARELLGVPYADAVEDREQRQDEGANLEEALKRALHSNAGAKERWAGRIKTGLSDKDLKEAIGEEFYSEGGSCGPGMASEYHRGGREPKFWLDYGPVGRPTLTGKRLVDTVRVLLGVPYAGADKGAEVEPKNARKERRQLKAVQEGGYHGARLKQSLVDVMEGPKLIGAEGAWKELVWQVRTLGSIVAQCEEWLEEARMATAAEGEGEMARDLNKEDRAKLLELVESGVPEAAIRECVGPLGKPLTAVEFARNLKLAMVDAGKIKPK